MTSARLERWEAVERRWLAKELCTLQDFVTLQNTPNTNMLLRHITNPLFFSVVLTSISGQKKNLK